MSLETDIQGAKKEADKIEAALRGDVAKVKTRWPKIGHWVLLAAVFLAGFILGVKV